MEQIIKTKQKTVWLVLLLISGLFAACKKDVTASLPGNQEAVNVNFYSASDVMGQVYRSSQVVATIYVNRNKESKPANQTNDPYTPCFSYGFGSSNFGGIEYPFPETGSLKYIAYNSGPHQLAFTDSIGAVILDTLVNPKPGSYTCMYLADAAATSGTVAAYRLIPVQEDRTLPPAGKIGVHFLNLSPDAGELTCNLQKPDGSLQPLPGTLPFGIASEYQYFDSTAVAAGVIHFSLGSASTGAAVVTGVPFNAGRRYMVIINGFFKDQQLKIHKAWKPDSTTRDSTVTISRNLRGFFRTIH